MKKTLAAVAVLGAFAGSALAADVQLYGIVDEGLAYSHVDLDGAADATDSFSMNSGMQSGSRFGFKGTEDLGNGLTVGFVLENGFSADTGADNDDYLKDSQHGDEGKTNVDRYASLAVTGTVGNLQFVGAYENFNHASTSIVKDDGHLVHLGGNYDFGVTKVFALAQYYQGIRNAAGWDMSDDLVGAFGPTNPDSEGTDGFKGYGLHIGSITPIAGGDLTLAAYFQDGKLENVYDGDPDKYDIDAQYVGVSARYAYHLSKRTDAYLGAGYAKATLDTGSLEGSVFHDMEKELIQAYVGLTHRF